MTDEEIKKMMIKSAKDFKTRTERSKTKCKKPRKVFNKKTRRFEDEKSF
jgi:hypothetical protein